MCEKKNVLLIKTLENTCAFSYLKDVLNNGDDDVQTKQIPSMSWLWPSNDLCYKYALAGGWPIPDWIPYPVLSRSLCITAVTILPLIVPLIIFNKYNMCGATADLLSQSVAGPVTQAWSQLQKKNDDVCLSRFESLRWTASQVWYRPSVITETAVCHKLPAALMDNLLVDIVRGRNM